MKLSLKDIPEYSKIVIPLFWGFELLLFFLFIFMPIDFVDNPYDVHITVFIALFNMTVGMLMLIDDKIRFNFINAIRILIALFFIFVFPLFVGIFYMFDNWCAYEDWKILYRSKNFPETVIKIEIENNGALGPMVYRPVKETKYSWIKMKNSIDTNSIDKSRWIRVEN